MKVIFPIILIVLSLISTAQDSTHAKFNVKVGVNYQSALHYYGRTDSLQSSGVFPQLELWSGEKAYLSITPVFINNSLATLQYAGTVATVGAIKSTESSFSHLYLMKPFYKDQTLVQSALKAQAGISHSFLSKVVNVTVGIDGKLSDNVDIGASAALDHARRFHFNDQSVLVIDPTITLNAGTQQFTSTYYKQSQFMLFPATQETRTVKKFSLLSYEASIPIIYKKRGVMFTVTPAYVIPKNLIAIGNDTQTTEQGKNMFYILLSAKITL